MKGEGARHKVGRGVESKGVKMNGADCEESIVG